MAVWGHNPVRVGSGISFHVEDKDLLILHSQYHGETSSQDIKNNGIDLVCSEYYGFNTKRVKQLPFQ